MSLYAGSASVLTFRIAANLYPHPQPAGAGQPDCISTSPSLFRTSIVWCMVCFITTSALTSRYANLTLSCPSSAKVHINFQRPSLTLRPKPSRLPNFTLLSCLVRFSFPSTGFQVFQMTIFSSITVCPRSSGIQLQNSSLSFFSQSNLCVCLHVWDIQLYPNIPWRVSATIVPLAHHNVCRPVNMYRPTSQASWSHQCDDIK